MKSSRSQPEPTHPQPVLRLLPLLVALGLGLAFHGWLLTGLDLRDLPGPGGVLVVRDLLLGEHQQGPVSWLGTPLVLLGLRADLAVRLMMSLSLLAAMLGAALATWALAGTRTAPWAALLTACWATAAHQSWLLDPGGPAWGLAWLGLGLAWWGCARHRLGLAALGGALLVLGVATKASALPVLVLLVAAPWLRSIPDAPAAARQAWLWRCAALAIGLLLGAAIGWLLQSPSQPWLGAQAAEGGAGAGGLQAILSLPGRGLPMGSFPLLAALAVVGAALLARRQPVALGVLALTLLALALVGEARAERLQPRHLLPASLGLIVLVAAMGAVRRPRGLAPAVLALLCGLGALDSLAFAGAFADQRARFAQTEPTTLPSAPSFLARRFAEPPWLLFHESSIAGAVELMALPAGAPGAVASPPYQERRDAHLEVATLLAGRVYRHLDATRCCAGDQPLGACAAGVVSGLDTAGALLVLPGKNVVVAPEARPFAQALLEAGSVRERRAVRWYAIQGQGDGGELPCRGGR
jgi:hypothetical protein